MDSSKIILKDIEQREEELRLAMINSDLLKLDELIHEDLIFTLPSGDIISKADDLKVHKSGIQKINDLTCISREIKIFSNFAIVACKMKLEGFYGDINIDENYSYTRVWVNKLNQWKVTAGHVSVIA